MTQWEKFFDEKIKEIAREKLIIDLGGGERFQKELASYQRYFQNTDYKTLDFDASAQPDIVGDIHHLPFEDNSIDAVICKAVLEHVQEPSKAAQEIYRVLRPGGKCFAYLPFLYPYHAHPGHYNDYFRFTADGVKLLFKNFQKIEICPVRGRFETINLLLPTNFIRKIAAPLNRFLDKILPQGNQVSGFNIYLIK